LNCQDSATNFTLIQELYATQKIDEHGQQNGWKTNSTTILSIQLRCPFLSQPSGIALKSVALITPHHLTSNHLDAEIHIVHSSLDDPLAQLVHFLFSAGGCSQFQKQLAPSGTKWHGQRHAS